MAKTTITLPHTITNSVPADGTKVMDNDQAIIDAINTTGLKDENLAFPFTDVCIPFYLHTVPGSGTAEVVSEMQAGVNGDFVPTKAVFSFQSEAGGAGSVDVEFREGGAAIHTAVTCANSGTVYKTTVFTDTAIAVGAAISMHATETGGQAITGLNGWLYGKTKIRS